MTLKNTFVYAVILLALAGSAVAGTTNFANVTITPTADDTYAFCVYDTAGTRMFSVTKAGVVYPGAIVNVELTGSVTLGTLGTDVLTINSDDVILTAAAKVTLPATAYFTQMRVGTGSSTGHSADAADCLYVEGITEIDGVLYGDGGVRAPTYKGTDGHGGLAIADSTGDVTVHNDIIVTGDVMTPNIKANDGTASITIADSTGAVAVAPAISLNGNITLGDNASDVITATGYFTKLRAGTGSTSGHTATAADALFVEGVAEIDGAAYCDTTLDVAGIATLAADVDLTATGGSTSDGDFTVAGYAEFAGTTELSGASIILGDAAGDVVTVNSDDFQFTAAAKVTFPDTAYFTQLRVGTGSSTGHTATGADGLYVEGITEIDGALFADSTLSVDGVATLAADVDLSATGGSTSDGDLTVAGYAKFAGVAELDGLVQLDALVTAPMKGELVIAADGSVIVTGAYHTVDTESDGATDDLVTITGGTDGMIVVLQAANTARDVVIKSTGNIVPGSDITFDDTERVVALIYSSRLSKWLVLSNMAN
jgi:hypothetical protein